VPAAAPATLEPVPAVLLFDTPISSEPVRALIDATHHGRGAQRGRGALFAPTNIHGLASTRQQQVENGISTAWQASCAGPTGPHSSSDRDLDRAGGHGLRRDDLQ